MGGRGAIWCNGPLIAGTERVSRPFVVMGFNYERGVGEMLEDLGHRAENIMEHVFRDVPETSVENQESRAKSSWWQRLLGKDDKASALDTRTSSLDIRGNLWRQFIRYDKTHPGAASCGNVHFAPSSLSDYDWGNRRAVPSNADDWLNYPDFTGQTRQMTCADWGHGDIRAHHIWWMQRFPHIAGSTPTGKLNNWWDYIVGLRW